jgi:hypothetical protein
VHLDELHEPGAILVGQPISRFDETPRLDVIEELLLGTWL